MNGEKDKYLETLRYGSVGEKRVVRSLTNLYRDKRICDFPTDRDSLHDIEQAIIRSVDYCYRRVENRGRIEYEMLDELNNIAIVILGYQQIEDGDLTCEFNKALFKYLLLHGLECDKQRVVKMLIKSRLLAMLSICIQNHEIYTFTPDIMSEYYKDTHINIKDKNLLYMMTYQVCIPEKKDFELKMDALTVDEILTGIKYGTFNGHDEKVYGRIRDKVVSLSKDPDKYREYHDIVKKVLLLHDKGAIDIGPFSGYVKWHILYRVRYEPDTVDFAILDLNSIKRISNLNTATGIKKAGGYELYKRAREYAADDPGFACCLLCSIILSDMRFARAFEEEQETGENI